MTQKLTELAHKANRNISMKNAERRVRRLLGSGFLVLLLSGIGLKMAGSNNELVEQISRIALFMAAVCAFLYIITAIYFDLLAGSTSTYSRSGAHVVAASSSIMFWIIAGGKTAGALIIFGIGFGVLKKTSSSAK